MANGKFGGGNGTTASPYLVEDEADLIAINNGLTKHYKQSKDIVITKEHWDGIAHLNLPFTGTFDGAGYEISGLAFRFNNIEKLNKVKMTNSNVWATGLFNSIETPGTIKNINVDLLIDIAYTPTDRLPYSSRFPFHIGSLCGQYYSTRDVENCHAKVVITTELPRGRTNYDAMYIFNIGGLVGGSITTSISSNFTSCSVDIKVNMKATVGNVPTYPDSILSVYGVGAGYLYGTVSDLVFRLEVATSLSSDDITGKTTSNSQFRFCGLNLSRCIDCEITLLMEEKPVEGTGITIPFAILNGESFMNSPERCVLINSNVRARNRVSPFGISNKDCRTLNSRLVSIDADAYGVFWANSTTNSATYTSTRALVKDCHIEGVTNAAGIGACHAVDCNVVNTTVKSAGRASGIVSADCTVLRCVFTGGWVEGNFSHLGGLLTSLTSGSSVKNSFFLGQYVKGLGATTIQSGLISALGHSGNANNYSLDSAQLILE